MPQLAELVYDRNKDRTKYPLINLKGFIVSLLHLQLCSGLDPDSLMSQSHPLQLIIECKSVKIKHSPNFYDLDPILY